ncbi:hypothetical protein MJO29_001776 [Puccinia striiformis f. sp. tritici]|nr:hypothetical protein MJO29_001776 [Puccinia striiformis f. sp. tritici]
MNIERVKQDTTDDFVSFFEEIDEDYGNQSSVSFQARSSKSNSKLLKMKNSMKSNKKKLQKV